MKNATEKALRKMELEKPKTEAISTVLFLHPEEVKENKSPLDYKFKSDFYEQEKKKNPYEEKAKKYEDKKYKDKEKYKKA